MAMKILKYKILNKRKNFSAVLFLCDTSKQTWSDSTRKNKKE